MEGYKAKEFAVTEVIPSAETCLLQNDRQSTAECLLRALSSNTVSSNKLADSEDSIPSFKDVFNQVCCMTSFTVLQAGMVMAYSSVLLEQLHVDDKYNVSKEENSWIASLAVLSTPIGSLICGPLMDKVGRKSGILISCLVSLIGWVLLLLVTPKFYMPLILLGRILGGLGGGMTTIAIIYIPEVCHEKYRPMMLGTNSMLVSLGVLLVTVTGYFMKWRMMAFGFSLVILANMIILRIYMPESPVWLLTMKKNRELAERNLRSLNPNETVYEKQLMYLNKLATSRKESFNDDGNGAFLTKKLKLVSHDLFSPPAKLPLLILIGLLMLQQLCGGYTIIVYTIQVFKKLGNDFGEGIDEYTALLFMGILRFLFSVITAVISQVIGRRPLLLFSALGMAISSISIPFYQYIVLDQLNSKSELNEVQWPVIFALIFVSFSAIGINNIPWSLIGELLPLNVRGTASGCLVAFAYMIMFFVVKLYPFILDTFNIHLLFLIQGLVCLFTALYVYIFIPETLGKSLHAIQEHFYTKKEKTTQS